MSSSHMQRVAWRLVKGVLKFNVLGGSWPRRLKGEQTDHKLTEAWTKLNHPGINKLSKSKKSKGIQTLGAK